MIDATEALDALPVQVAILDRSGTIVRVNDAWRRRMGASSPHDDGTASLALDVGTNYLDEIDPTAELLRDHGSDVAAAVRSVLRGVLPSHSVDYPHEVAGGRRWFRMTAVPVHVDHQLDGAVIVQIDITEQRVAEQEAIRSNEQLAAAYNDVESFAVAVAADLAEPLRTVGLALGALHRDTALSDRQIELLDDLETAVLRVQRTVRGVHRMVESQSSDLVVEIVDTGALVAEIVEDVEPLLAERRGHLDVGELPLVVGSRFLLEHLFQHLVENAIEHGRRGSDGPRIRVSARSDSTGHLFTVDDAGPGLDAEQRRLAFTPLWRGESADAHGSGMGLTVCRHAVNRHGGDIWFDDSPSGGLSVVVHLPRQLGGTIDRHPSAGPVAGLRPGGASRP
ncbi:MAG: HAMP domain-containing sensor histidine kinase [Actinomycetota bacterium]